PLLQQARLDFTNGKEDQRPVVMARERHAIVRSLSHCAKRQPTGQAVLTRALHLSLIASRGVFSVYKAALQDPSFVARTTRLTTSCARRQ
ncbi:MAG TPA: hypothetical protein VK777_10180, partial [Reyranella sp.]|nr:hypothetical protein [Reyranella sp.]